MASGLVVPAYCEYNGIGLPSQLPSDLMAVADSPDTPTDASLSESPKSSAKTPWPTSSVSRTC